MRTIMKFKLAIKKTVNKMQFYRKRKPKANRSNKSNPLIKNII